MKKIKTKVVKKVGSTGEERLGYVIAGWSCLIISVVESINCFVLGIVIFLILGAWFLLYKSKQ